MHKGRVDKHRLKRENSYKNSPKLPPRGGNCRWLRGPEATYTEQSSATDETLENWSQLCSLERRTSRAGKDSVDHGPTRNDCPARAGSRPAACVSPTGSSVRAAASGPSAGPINAASATKPAADILVLGLIGPSEVAIVATATGISSGKALRSIQYRAWARIKCARDPWVRFQARRTSSSSMAT